MNSKPKAILISGPAGVGKSTLAKRLSHELGWVNISEDDYWVKNGWNGHRTEDQESIVQNQVIEELFSNLNESKNVVLEFILYKIPPNPLTNYQKILEANKIPYKTIILKSSADEIEKRRLRRGRQSDVDKIEERSSHTLNQLSVLEADFIKPEWIIDSTNQTPDELCAYYLKKLE